MSLYLARGGLCYLASLHREKMSVFCRVRWAIYESQFSGGFASVCACVIATTRQNQLQTPWDRQAGRQQSMRLDRIRLCDHASRMHFSLCLCVFLVGGRASISPARLCIRTYVLVCACVCMYVCVCVAVFSMRNSIGCCCQRAISGKQIRGGVRVELKFQSSCKRVCMCLAVKSRQNCFACSARFGNQAKQLPLCLGDHR